MDSVLIPCFLTNFLITKSRLSLSNTEILCEENLKFLLTIICKSYDRSKSFNTKKHPFKRS